MRGRLCVSSFCASSHKSWVSFYSCHFISFKCASLAATIKNKSDVSVPSLVLQLCFSLQYFASLHFSKHLWIRHWAGSQGHTQQNVIIASEQLTVSEGRQTYKQFVFLRVSIPQGLSAPNHHHPLPQFLSFLFNLSGEGGYFCLCIWRSYFKCRVTAVSEICWVWVGREVHLPVDFQKSKNPCNMDSKLRAKEQDPHCAINKPSHLSRSRERLGKGSPSSWDQLPL